MRNLPGKLNQEPSLSWIDTMQPYLLPLTLLAVTLLFAGCSQIKDIGPTGTDEEFSIVVDQDGRLQFDDDDAITEPWTEELAPALDSIRALLEQQGEEVTSVVIVSKGSTILRFCGWSAAGVWQCIQIKLR